MLQKIIDATKNRVFNLKNAFTLNYFRDSPYFETSCVSLKEYLLRKDKNGIIAEFKRISPSKGKLNEFAEVSNVSVQYMASGCSALSILTEPHFFGGSSSDLIIARNYNLCPVLRKDFIIDPIQVYESKSFGADVILIIARILSKHQVEELTNLALSLGLEIILEINNSDDLKKYDFKKHIAGINSRDLLTMQINKQTHFKMIEFFDEEAVVIAESGIDNIDDLLLLKKAGYNGFLIGSQFMKHANPGDACKLFANKLNTYDKEFVY